MNCPMMVDKLSFSKDRRQRYLYYKGWAESRGKVPTIVQRRSYAHAYVLENMRPVILDNELIVGQPDFAPLSGDEKIDFENIKVWRNFIPFDDGRTDHMSLDFEKLLKVGVNGLISEIKANMDRLDLNCGNDIEKMEFYLSAIMELEALLKCAENYSVYAKKLSENATGQRKAELTEISEILTRVPKNPATTFREALQSMHFYTFCLWGLYQCGHPDRYLYDYYRNDIDKGIITPQEAQELIDCFCMMYTTYIVSSSSVGFMIGGRDQYGNNTENELTWHFMNSIPHTNTADPSIGFCVNNDTSAQLLDYASELLSRGFSHPAIYNDELIPVALQKYGVNEDDSHDYIHCCCTEITVNKKSNVWTVSPYHNLLQYFIDVVKNNPDASSCEELLSAFDLYVRTKIVEENNKQNMYQLERYRNGAEPLLVSCLVDNCIEKGRGIYNGGAVYNWIQPNFLGTSNVADSLLAIEKLVYADKKLTLRQFVEILEKNYADNEDIRQEIIKAVPHFGVGESKADELYKRIAEIVNNNCKGIKTFRGDILIPAMFSYNEHIRYGKRTQASFDGRLAEQPLADGSGPAQGRDKEGPTSLIRSVTSWDQSVYLGGIAMNLKINKTDDKKRQKALTALISSYLKLGGIELQVNAVNADELRDAMINPQNYSHLIVRVGGYSDYFTSLSKQLQEEIISRTQHFI